MGGGKQYIRLRMMIEMSKLMDSETLTCCIIKYMISVRCAHKRMNDIL